MTEIEDRLRLPPEPTSAGAARRFVARVLHDCDVDMGLVSLLVSELVSNVVLHARTPLEVGVRTRGRHIRVSVTDESPLIPAMKAYAPDSVTGRGLTIVDSSAARWGIDEHPQGKAVWFEVPLANSTSAP
jgi:anti-sigma regulatory factor (Ser/Thr protein kinase)